MNRTAIYRAFDAAGSLLYVGIAGNWAQRWCRHAQDSPWFYDVARLDVTWYPTKAEALIEEARAIKSESPQHNWAYTPRAATRRA